MEEIKLASGNTLNYGDAPILSSYKLFQRVMIAFKNAGIEIKLDRNTELSFLDIFEKNSGAIVGAMAEILASDEVLKAVLECAAKSNYETATGKAKITLDAFEEHREDLFPVLKEIAWRHLRAFFPKVPTL